MSGLPSRSIRFWITYLLVAVVFILSAVEGAVRLLHLAPPLPPYGFYAEDPYLPYKNHPFSSGRSKKEEFEFEYRHNSLGFRDVEHTLTKAPGVFRIIGLGDSFTYGATVPLEDSYLYVLEEILNNRPGIHPRVEIIKAGIPRFFPEPERLLLQHYGVQFQPDLILVGFVPNDVIDTYFGTDAVKVENGYLKTHSAEQIGEVGTWLYVHSHLCRLILRGYAEYMFRKEYDFDWSAIYEPDGQHEKDWQKVELEYGKMLELARQIDAEIVFVHIPQKRLWDDAAAYPASRLSRWCTGRGVAFIDTLPAMKKASVGEALYWEKDGHCTSAGYRVIAETIYSELTEGGFVP